MPWGITLDSDGNIYVADWRNDRIQKFTAEGKFLAVFGEHGEADGQLNHPSSVAVDSEGYVYVADWGNERVQVFDPEGGFVMKLRGSAGLSKWAEDFLRANADEAEGRAKANLEPEVGQFGGDPHEESSHIEKYFWAPVSVKLDDYGRLYVTESNRHRVQVYERGS
jgi:DNA-binding beta-propeller fold protein YncE